MTFFLKQSGEVPRAPVDSPAVDLPTYAEGLGAAITVSRLENDANFVAARRKQTTKAGMALDVARRIGGEEMAKRMREAGMPDGVADTFPAMVDRGFTSLAGDISDFVLGQGRTDAASDPEAWADMDLSDEAIEARTNEVLRKEYEDAQQVIAMMNGGETSARLLGGMIGITADVKNVPFLLMGAGGGSIARIIAQEAAINMAAEAAFLPSQFKMAERLDIADPDVVTQLAIAAAAGGALGGAIAATGRGLAYIQQRNATPPIRGLDDIQAESFVNQVEDVLASDTPKPFQEIARITERAAAESAKRPFILENPINPEKPPLVPDEPTTPPADPAPDVSTEIEELTRQADDLASQDGTARKPLVSALRDSHKPRKDDPLQAAGPEMRIDPNGPLGQELKQRLGTNNLNQRAPGLFSKKGVSDLDNLVASEWEDMYPGISRATGISDDGMYLDRDGLIDVLVRDIEGDSTWLSSRADAERLRAQAFAMDGPSALDDFRAQKPADDGLFIDPEVYRFDVSEDEAMANIEAAVLRYIEDNDLGDIVTDIEKREIIDQLQTSGGESKYLVELIAEREAAAVRAELKGQADADEIPFGEPGIRDGSGTGQPETVAERQGSGSEIQGDSPGAARQTEVTPEGQQTLIDGVAPISARDRLEAQQNAPMRGGNAAADDGLFDVGGRDQLDIFDDVNSPEARAIDDINANEIRESAVSDGEIPMEFVGPDGNVRSMSATEGLDMFDEIETFSARIDLCGKGPA